MGLEEQATFVSTGRRRRLSPLALHVDAHCLLYVGESVSREQRGEVPLDAVHLVGPEEREGGVHLHQTSARADLRIRVLARLDAAYAHDHHGTWPQNACTQYRQ